jgi:hypothetical protein
MGRPIAFGVTLAGVAFLMSCATLPAPEDGDGMTPPMLAAENNKNPAVVNALLKTGTDAMARDHFGRTPLRDAASNPNPAVVVSGSGAPPSRSSNLAVPARARPL